MSYTIAYYAMELLVALEMSKFSPVDGDDQSEADREEESGLHGDCEAVACSPCGLCEADGLGVAA